MSDDQQIIDALCNIDFPHEDVAYNTCLCGADAKCILAAIRDGRVPGVTATGGNPVLLSEWQRQERDISALRAQVETLTRERDALKAGGLNQKPFLYGMAFIDGTAVVDEVCVCESPDELQETAESLNANVLPLYTGPQVLKMADERDSANARAVTISKMHDEAITRAEKAEAERDDVQTKYKCMSVEVDRALSIGHHHQKRADALQARVGELEQSIGAQMKSNERARALYAAAHPEQEGKWPDRTDMVLWMMGRIDELEQIALMKTDSVSTVLEIAKQRDAAQAEVARMRDLAKRGPMHSRVLAQADRIARLVGLLREAQPLIEPSLFRYIMHDHGVTVDESPCLRHRIDAAIDGVGEG